ncbi:MAG: hypothetical protein ACM3JC_15230 [Rudaea sp.]
MFESSAAGGRERSAPVSFTAESPRRGNLATLPDFPFPVAASRGAKRAARRIAERALAAYTQLDRTLGVRPALSLQVLARSDWSAYASAAAYGVVHDGDDDDLVVGAEPADAWHTVSAHFADRLTPAACARLCEVHGVDVVNGRGPALDALAETLIAHELAHRLARDEGIAFPRRWLAEAFANLALVVVLGETDPAGLHLVGSLAEAAATLDDDLPTLAEFETQFGRMDVARSVQAELMITRAAYAAYAQHGAVVLARFHAALAAPRDARDADYELGRMLAARVHPAIAAIPGRFAPREAPRSPNPLTKGEIA